MRDWTTTDDFTLVGATSFSSGRLEDGTAKSCLFQGAYEGCMYRYSTMRQVIIKPISSSEFDISQCSSGTCEALPA